jgi:hypothetical protein
MTRLQQNFIEDDLGKSAWPMQSAYSVQSTPTFRKPFNDIHLCQPICLSMANSCSSGDRHLEQPAAMLPPSV